MNKVVQTLIAAVFILLFAAPALRAQRVEPAPTPDGGHIDYIFDNHDHLIRINKYNAEGRQVIQIEGRERPSDGAQKMHINILRKKANETHHDFLPMEETDYGFDAKTGDRYIKHKIRNTYNKNDQLTKSETFGYDSNGNEVPEKQVENIYNADGVLLVSNTYSFDTHRVYVLKEKVSYLRSEKDRLIHIIDPKELSKDRKKREVITFNPDGSKVIKYQMLMGKTKIWETVREFQEPPPTIQPGISMAKPAPTTSAALASATPRWLQGAYISANLGVAFTSASSITTSFGENFTAARERGDAVDYFAVKSAGSMAFPGSVNPSVVGGIKIGRFGCCFSDAPIWNYFGWSMDVSYQRYSLSQQSGTFQRTTWVNGDLFSQGAGTAALQGDGSLFTLAFLVNARYGFLPTPENPFGTLQPYGGVGPALVVNRFDPKIMLTSFNGNRVNGGLDFNGETSVNVGLAAEGGVRYFPIQHVFLDLSYRYLRSRPDFSFTSNTAGMKLDNTINNSSVRFGVGYAF